MKKRAMKRQLSSTAGLISRSSVTGSTHGISSSFSSSSSQQVVRSRGRDFICWMLSFLLFLLSCFFFHRISSSHPSFRTDQTTSARRITTMGTKNTQRTISSSSSFSNYELLDVQFQTTRRIRTDMPNVAICIAGQLRTFIEKPVHKSILHHVLEPLRDAGYSIHTFFHLSDSDIDQVETRLQHHHNINNNNNNNNDDDNNNQNIFLPFAPAFFSFSQTPQSKTQCPVPKCNAPYAQHIDTICPHTLLRADECMHQVKKYEQRQGKKFSWIIRTRPDIAFATNISIPTVTSSTQYNNVIYTNMHMPEMSIYAHQWLRQQFPQHASNVLIDDFPIGDLVHIVHANVAHILFSASQAFSDCHLFQFKNGTIGPEVALAFWLVKHNIKYKPMHWMWMIVRRHMKPVCSNVLAIHTGDEHKDRDMMDVCDLFERTGVLRPLSWT